MRYRITRDGKPIGLCPSDAIVEADTPLAALGDICDACGVHGDIAHAGSVSAAVVLSGFRFEAEEVRDA